MDTLKSSLDLPAEIEAKFYPISKEKLRRCLQDLGAVCLQPETLMRRVIYNKNANPLLQGTYLRVRDEGKTVRISVKVTAHVEGNIADQKEIDITTDNFEGAKLLLAAIGCKETMYQENLRETWKYRNSEIVIDSWPGLEPYTEIESPNEGELQQIVQELDLPWHEKCIGSTDDLYARVYGITKDAALKMLEVCTFEQNPFEKLSPAE